MENQSNANNSMPVQVDRTKNTSDDKASQFSKPRLTTAAIFAFLPHFGTIGVHNFILKQYGSGIAHIIIVVACCIPHVITSALCDRNISCYGVVTITLFLQYLAVASYILSIIEGVQILKSKKQNIFLRPVANDSDVVQTKRPQKLGRKVWSVLSIIITMIPILLLSFCFIISGGDQGVWWLMIMYYGTLGIPLAVMSIVFGMLGLKTSLRWLSIVSLLLKIAMIITMMVLLFIALQRV